MIKIAASSLITLLLSVVCHARPVDQSDTLVKSSQLIIIEQGDYNVFESRMIYADPERKEGEQSCMIKGHIPRGLRIVNQMDFEYQKNDEIIVKIDSRHIKHFQRDSICPVLLTDLLFIGDTPSPGQRRPYEMYYSILSRTYSKAERRKRIFWKHFPDNHLLYLIKGLNADIYVIVREKRAKEFLSVILSGCDLSLAGMTVSELLDSIKP